MNSFREIDKLEKRERFFNRLVEKTSGKIPISDLQELAFADTVTDITQKEILVVTDAKEMADRLTMYNRLEESDHGSEGDEEFGLCLIGECEFGEEVNKTYFDNGNRVGGVHSSMLPDFDISKPLVVSISSHSWCSWPNNAGNHDEKDFKFVVYLPSGQ